MVFSVDQDFPKFFKVLSTREHATNTHNGNIIVFIHFKSKMNWRFSRVFFSHHASSFSLKRKDGWSNKSRLPHSFIWYGSSVTWLYYRLIGFKYIKNYKRLCSAPNTVKKKRTLSIIFWKINNLEFYLYLSFFFGCYKRYYFSWRQQSCEFFLMLKREPQTDKRYVFTICYDKT